MKILFSKKKMLLFFCLIGSFLFAQTAVAPVQEETVKLEKTEPGTFFFTLGPTILINTDRNLKSAPTPVLFSGGFGANIPIIDFLQFSPSVSFFMNYYLWTGKEALPAEIENRTVLTPTFFFDLPIVYLIKKQHTITSLGVGAGVLVRYGFLASGVPAGDAHHVGLINDYFWQSGRWFYPSLQVSWDYVFTNGLAAGAGLKVFLPIAAAFDKNVNFVQNMLITLSVRFHLSKNYFSKQ